MGIQRIVLETVHLYEVREVDDEFRVYFRKKKGFKFKKACSTREHSVAFAHDYMRYCCLECQQRGWVYKTRKARERFMYWDGANHSMGFFRLCPECQSDHQVCSSVELCLVISE